MKLKDKIKNWLFKDEVNDFRKAMSSLKDIESEYEHAKRQAENAEQKMLDVTSKANESLKISEATRKLINSICEVGTDVNRYERDSSWAVICVHGKMDYVKFVPMAPNDIITISRFLKQFEYSNRVTDTPMRFAFEDCITKW